VCNPISNKLKNQFLNFVYEKNKELDETTVSKKTDKTSLEADIKTAIVDGTITSEELKVLKDKYIGEKVEYGSPEMKTFLATVNSGLGGSALEALEKLAASKTDDIGFVLELNDKTRIIDFDGDGDRATGTANQIINRGLAKNSGPKETAQLISNISETDLGKAARKLAKISSEEKPEVLKEIEVQVLGRLLRLMDTKDLNKVLSGLDSERKETLFEILRKTHIPNPDGIKVPAQVYVDFPNLKALDGVLKVEDYDSPLIKKQVSDLAKYPESVLKKLKGTGIKEIHIAALAIPDLDSNSSLKGKNPRNWSDGKTWEIVPGAYSPENDSVSIGAGGHGSGALAIHETGHAIGAKFKDDKGIRLDASAEMVSIHKQIFAKLNPYEQGGKDVVPGNIAGCEETFAESLSNLLELGEAETVKKYSQEMVDFLKKYVIK
jgi:hypothetical protein